MASRYPSESLGVDHRLPEQIPGPLQIRKDRLLVHLPFFRKSHLSPPPWVCWLSANSGHAPHQTWNRCQTGPISKNTLWVRRGQEDDACENPWWTGRSLKSSLNVLMGAVPIICFLSLLGPPHRVYHWRVGERYFLRLKHGMIIT
jgi:hypothetical protein